MPNEPETPSPREVRFTPEFKRNLRQLAKKYRRIRSDIQPVIDALIAGDLPGDRIQGSYLGYPVFEIGTARHRAERDTSYIGGSGRKLNVSDWVIPNRAALGQALHPAQRPVPLCPKGRDRLGETSRACAIGGLAGGRCLVEPGPPVARCRRQARHPWRHCPWQCFK